MRTSSDIKATKRKPPLALITIILLVVAGASLAAMWLYQTRNYAKEVAAPLEKSLVKMDGVQKCSRGDSGRGSDNNLPWYEAYLELPIGKAEAEANVTRIASEAGYKLVPASPTKKGQLSFINDAYIEDWYFDNTSKTSPYTALSDGPIQLAFGVNASGAKEACGKAKTIRVDDSHSVVNISVRLPELKR